MKSPTKSTNEALYDKAIEYTFSDWVVPYAFGVGVENLNETYLGGFPDLSSFLDRSKGRVRIKFPTFQKMINRGETRFGKILKTRIRGKTFVDLGCGLPERSVIPRLLAQAYQATEYIGVDHLNVTNESKENEFSQMGKFKSKFVREDIINFLKSYKTFGRTFFFMAGVEPVKGSRAGQRYMQKLTELFHKVLQPGDVLVLGAGTPNLDLQKEKFSRMYGDQYQEVFCRENSWGVAKSLPKLRGSTRM